GGRSKSKRSVRMVQVSLPGPPPAIRLSDEAAAGARVRSGHPKVRLSRVERHPRLDDLVGVLDRLAALDLVDILHARGHLAPNSVLFVEERRVLEANEELAVAGIGIGRAGHRRRAPHVRFVIEFGLEFLTGATGAGAMRAA